MIRKFRKQDTKRLCYLIRRCINETLKDYYPKDVVGFLHWENTPKRFLNRMHKRDICLVYEKDDKLFGSASLEGNDIKDVYVNPSYHRRGIGKGLIREIEKIALSKNMKKLKVMSSFNAQPFYEKCGFKKIRKFSKPIRDIVLEGIYMEKQL